MLSFASHRPESGLADIIEQLSRPTSSVNVRQVCNAAVEQFAAALGDLLGQYSIGRNI
jgi:hypothetical protein